MAVSQREIDAILRTDLSSFVQKTFSTVDPGTTYSHNWHIDLIAEYLEACTRREIKRLIINIPPRYPKLLAAETPVPTPRGVRCHGDLRVGDEVFSPGGKPVKVIAVMPKDVADYEVIFSNGQRIACNLDHLWTVYDRAGRKWRTLRTGQILRTKYYSGGRCRFQLPDSACLQYPEQELPLSPYFLGAWLGDGTWNKPCITHHVEEKEIVESIVADGYAVSTQCLHPCGTTTTTYFSKNGIGKVLQSLGVWKNKHIPSVYLRGSVAQRLELLAGVIDTDGHVDHNGRVVIVGINRRLFGDLFRLCEELGFRPYVTWQKTQAFNGYGGDKDKWMLGFNPTVPIPTRVLRKRILAPHHHRRNIGITRIDLLNEPKQGNCISVDSKDGLYIVGRRHVVTHNSIAVTVGWPAWLLGRNPSERIIAASYAHTLSLKHSIDCRLVIKADWYRRIFPATKLVDDQDTKQKFVTTARGMRYATSVDGSAIGEGGDFLIVDDPHSAAGALSDVQRASACTWFDQGFATRLNDKKNGVIVVVMQRLHAEDLTGHLLAKGGWEHLCIPALAEGRTVIDFGRVKVTRLDGEPLHPDREDLAAIAKQKVALGSYAFAGQYQQRPAPAEGGIFKTAWFRRYDRPQETYSEIVQSWDTAFKPGELNDPSVCTTWGVKPDGFDLLHVLVARMEYPDLKAKVVSQAVDWKPNAILIEDKASGQSLIQDARRETTLPVIPIQPKGDKIIRASGVSAMVEAGKVFLPKHAAWLTDYEVEMMTFPNGAHDDQVDSTSQFLEWARLRAAPDRPMIRRL